MEWSLLKTPPDLRGPDRDRGPVLEPRVETPVIVRLTFLRRVRSDSVWLDLQRDHHGNKTTNYKLEETRTKLNHLDVPLREGDQMNQMEEEWYPLAQHPY